MPSFDTRFAEGWRRGLEHLALAGVPLLSALLATEKIQRVATFNGFHFGLKLGLPVGIVDIWQFVSLPNESVSIGIPLPDAIPLLIVVLPLAVVVQAGLAAGYFGSLAAGLETGSFAFPANVRRYFGPFLGYTLIPMVVVAPLAVLGVSDTRLLPLGIVFLVPAFIVAGYLFYATPYLLVLRDTDLVAALRASYGFATAGGPYFRYAAGYAGLVLAVSLVATAVVVNLGVLGAMLGAVGGAPLGLACNATTMRFVADIDPHSPSLGEWTDQGSGEP